MADRTRRRSVLSKLLSSEENEAVLTTLGHEKKVEAIAGVEMFHVCRGSPEWTKIANGVACIVKDKARKSYYVSLVDIESKSIRFEKEIHGEFTYTEVTTSFHHLEHPGEELIVGLSFADEGEARLFSEAVQSKLNCTKSKPDQLYSQSSEKDDVMKEMADVSKPIIGTSQDTLVRDLSYTTTPTRKAVKAKDRLTKEDISNPSNFVHISHIGVDFEGESFEMSNVSSEWRQVLNTIGVTRDEHILEYTRKEPIEKLNESKRPPSLVLPPSQITPSLTALPDSLSHTTLPDSLPASPPPTGSSPSDQSKTTPIVSSEVFPVPSFPPAPQQQPSPSHGNSAKSLPQPSPLSQESTSQPSCSCEDNTSIPAPPVAMPVRQSIEKRKAKIPKAKLQHLECLGINSQTGELDVNSISSEWKQLLDAVGVTPEQLKDKKTAGFIYNFVEMHGGIEEAMRQLNEPKKSIPSPGSNEETALASSPHAVTSSPPSPHTVTSPPSPHTVTSPPPSPHTVTSPPPSPHAVTSSPPPITPKPPSGISIPPFLIIPPPPPQPPPTSMYGSNENCAKMTVSLEPDVCEVDTDFEAGLTDTGNI